MARPRWYGYLQQRGGTLLRQSTNNDDASRLSGAHPRMDRAGLGVKHGLTSPVGRFVGNL